MPCQLFLLFNNSGLVIRACDRGRVLSKKVAAFHAGRGHFFPLWFGGGCDWLLGGRGTKNGDEALLLRAMDLFYSATSLQ